MSKKKRKRPLRQFQCATSGCKAKGNTWLKKATESQCRKCGEDATLIPEGEEIGVFVFEFVCNCGKKYTGWCRRGVTAICYGKDYECGEQNHPGRIIPRGFIAKKSNKHHNCDECHGKRNCPILRERDRQKRRRSTFSQ